MATTTEPPFVHKTVGVSPKTASPTTTRVINFTTEGDAPFTPTNGNLLVVVVFGGVTNTVTGWTEQLQPVSSGELSIFTKTAASDTGITLVHNGSNYAVGFCAMELPAGSTYTSGVSANDGSETFPTLTGLPGTAQLVFGARGRIAGATETAASVAWTGPAVKDADIFQAQATTDGFSLTVGHTINVTATSTTPAATTTYTGTWVVNDRERAVFAINAVAPGASTTPFTRDYGTPWRVTNAFTRDVATPWRVTNAFTADVVAPWRVLNAWTRDTAAPWRVFNAFTADSSAPWRVLNGFTRDVAAPWRVLNAWTADTALPWRVYAGFTRDYAAVWDVINGTSFTRDYGTPWRVLNSWTKDVGVPWRVTNSFTRDMAMPWRVTNAWSNDVAAPWRVLGAFTADYGVPWRVLNGWSNDYAAVWKVLNDTSFVRDYGVPWRVLNAFERDLLIRWRILSATPSLPLPADVVVWLNDYAAGRLESDQVTAYLD